MSKKIIHWLYEKTKEDLYGIYISVYGRNLKKDETIKNKMQRIEDMKNDAYGRIYVFIAEEIYPKLENDVSIISCVMEDDFSRFKDMIKTRFYSSLLDEIREKSHEKIRKILHDMAKKDKSLCYKAEGEKNKYAMFAFVDPATETCAEKFPARPVDAQKVKEEGFGGWGCPVYSPKCTDAAYVFECARFFWNQCVERHSIATAVTIQDFNRFLKKNLSKEVHALFSKKIDEKKFSQNQNNDDGSTDDNIDGYADEDEYTVAVLSHTEAHIVARQYASEWLDSLQSYQKLFFCLWHACGFGATEIHNILDCNSPQNAHAKIKSTVKRLEAFMSQREGLGAGEFDENIFQAFSTFTEETCHADILIRNCLGYAQGGAQ